MKKNKIKLDIGSILVDTVDLHDPMVVLLIKKKNQMVNIEKLLKSMVEQL
jgi:hypothetical protein